MPRIHEAGLISENAKAVQESLLGCLLREPALIDQVAAKLKTEMFDSNFGRVYAAVLAVRNGNTPVDLVSVGQELIKRNNIPDIGGYPGLVRIWESVPTAFEVWHWVEIILR